MRTAQDHIRRNKAIEVVREAMRIGKIIKPSICSKCSKEIDSLNLHAYHDDYDKPLEVIWLCIGCHFGLHKEKHKS